MSSIADVLSGAARWCVVHGDCLEVLPTLADKSVDHVITDPPYEAEAHTKQRRVKSGRNLSGGGVTDVMHSRPLSFEPLTEAIRSEPTTLRKCSSGMCLIRSVECRTN